MAYAHSLVPSARTCETSRQVPTRTRADLTTERVVPTMALTVPRRRYESFEMVMIEALACGTPVIAFPEGAARELVIDGKTGFLAGDEREMDAQSAGYPALRRRRRRHRLRAHVSLRRAPARRERTARC